MTQPDLTPKTARGARTQERILRAAEAEFGERGYHEGSIVGITQRAGIGQGTFYLYFKSKEDVLRSLVLYTSRQLRRYLSEQVIDTSDRLEAERVGFRAFLDYIADHPNLYRIVQESQFVDAAAHRAYYDAFAEGYQSALNQAGFQHSIRDGDYEVWAWSIMGIMHFVGQRYVLWSDDRPREAIVDAVMDFMFNGMKAPGS
ncbi:TetR/AcrR family transcriptional regulator [Saccharospirillum impatiens]|uniref:TetR/AcrR family transcriptional regulator n=1 Tax=Saccharospirillum impatiens TaxID=169438 RepID=UPI00041B69A0|nr:TetR/AcrR family transcriptional regulator [Saccharospirillum impatiens]